MPEDGHFVWAYHVVIENRGPETVRLLRRHWRITNARGELQEVRGPGVVGEQPGQRGHKRPFLMPFKMCLVLLMPEPEAKICGPPPAGHPLGVLDTPRLSKT